MTAAIVMSAATFADVQAGLRRAAQIAILAERGNEEARRLAEAFRVTPAAPARNIRGVSASYRRPWSLAYQGAVNALLLEAGVTHRGTERLLSAAELDEMGDAMMSGVSVEVFAGRIIERAADEEDRRRRNEWTNEAASV